MNNVGKKIKVLFLSNKIMHYRVPILNLIAKKCDLTVAYSELDIPQDMEILFKVIKLPIYAIKKRWVIQKNNIYKLANKYDVVLTISNVTWLKYTLLPFIPFRKFKVIPWGIGVSASYDKHYDEDRRLDWFRVLLYKASDAFIFYNEYPIKRFSKLGVDEKKLFSANNTVYVIPWDGIYREKDSLLFVGDIMQYKGLGILLEAYKKLIDEGIKLPPLNIIGDGDEFDKTQNWITSNALENRIFMRGAIYDPYIKAEYFRRAYALFSPKQAGLTVQEGMGYGVPMITDENAYTGGERLDIQDGITGIFTKNGYTVYDVLKEFSQNPQKFIDMGKNAEEFYKKCRKASDMANNVWRAIEYVMNKS